MIAERTGGLGGEAEGGVQSALEGSVLVRYPVGVADEQQHVFAVAGAIAAFGQSLRESCTNASVTGDADTADLFTQASRAMDQQLWLVESHKAPK